MQSRFQQLDHFLVAHQSLWRFEPFYQSIKDSAQWQQDYPQLQDWLNGLSHHQIELLKSDSSELIKQLSFYVPELQFVADLVFLPRQPESSLSRNLNLEKGIPGRKQSQIQALGNCVLQNHQGKEWLEWCSGKGYLGRTLAFYSKQPVVSFEYQQALCESGQRDADQLSLPMTFVQGDAFDESSRQCFHSNQHAVALHACGDLHVQFMHYAAAAKTRAISFSPCCYHLIHSDVYQAQSELGRASELILSKSELRIPLQETVTGGDRVKRHRQLEMSFRLGFDALLTSELQLSDYCPIPSVKKSQLSGGFRVFCIWAAEQKGFVLPDVDFFHYEELGIQRFWEMERLSLVQQAFRRLLELWLVLDKAMFLQQHGYQVELSEFCDRAVTPRNILIHCERK